MGRWDDHKAIRYTFLFNEQTIQEMSYLATTYDNAVQEEGDLPPEKLPLANVGRINAKKHLEEHAIDLMSANIVWILETMLGTITF